MTERNDRSRNLVCQLETCGKEFERPGRHGPRPRFCSIKCRGRWQYSKPEIRAYQQAYAQRPERREIRKLASRARYRTEEYRAWARERWRRLFADRFSDVAIPSPYTGHRWLDMASQAVSGGRDVDPAFRDYGYHDEVGEAVLALLEGRDMTEAVREFRRQEYVPRHLTIRAGDWADDKDEDQWFEGLATVPSAEDEAVANETIVLELQSRMNWSTNKVRRLKAGSRRGSRGANRSYEKFRGRQGDGRRGREEYAA